MQSRARCSIPQKQEKRKHFRDLIPRASAFFYLRFCELPFFRLCFQYSGFPSYDQPAPDPGKLAEPHSASLFPDLPGIFFSSHLHQTDKEKSIAALPEPEPLLFLFHLFNRPVILKEDLCLRLTVIMQDEPGITGLVAVTGHQQAARIDQQDSVFTGDV